MMTNQLIERQAQIDSAIPPPERVSARMVRLWSLADEFNFRTPVGSSVLIETDKGWKNAVTVSEATVIAASSVVVNVHGSTYSIPIRKVRKP